ENPEIPVTGRMKWPDCEGLLVLLLRPSKVAGFALEDAELVVGIQIISVGGDSLGKRLGSFFRFTGSLVDQPQIEERSRQAGVLGRQPEQQRLRLSPLLAGHGRHRLVERLLRLTAN